MKNFNKNKRSAFSLIELSIVLIIIGLLIAGVTGGASLIKSSELRSAMGEARGYSVAVNAFYTQFDAYPCDFGTPISAGDTPGNEDSRIFYQVAGGTAEGHEAFRDLFTIGAITDNTLTYGAASAVSMAPGTNLPESKIKSAGWAFDNNGVTNVVVLTGTTSATVPDGTNALNASGTTSIFTAVLTPTDALSIDRKSDDGASISGDVRAVGANAAAASLATTDCHANDGNGAYNVAEEATLCGLSFNVDI